MAQKKSRQFSPEFRETAAREVVEKSRPVADVARDCGVTDQTIRNWVKQFQRTHAADTGLSLPERARLKELERRVKELEEENRFLGKSGGLLREEAPVTVKYAFIASEEGNHSVVDMCRWAEVSRSGFYDWRNRRPSATAQWREILEAEIRFCFDHSDGTYGYRRVHAQLARWGTRVDPDTVRKIMRQLGLVPCQPRPFRPVTTVAGDAADLPDRVARDFTADAPGRKLVGDITYIRTWEGWLYLATVLDCYSKKVVGYAMADHMRTELVTDALRMAARNLPIAAGETIFHSDRGSQYLSAEFAAVAKELGILRSVGRTGTCYDNAWAESFNGTLKNERVNRTQYPTREHARKDVIRYIELRYNQLRIHSAIDYRTPNEVESEWFDRNQAA
ncbi:IS3 family transposase [Nocardia puris]|nr:MULTISPECIES: IS3 family transposase [Nocardia]MBF6216439.1 IS3 family transposase [Nocardia puris]MBF6295897.1 IS3 family transposase [Nocardia farcinica]MBF6382471.1 IS3 family transposase [Nocardia farcinica]